MKYIVSARVKGTVAFELVEIEADDEDELREKIHEEMVEALADMDIIYSKEEVEEE